ncbi:hypothetical protein GQA12_21985 [Paenibacillus alvei]|nr:hypothetical protein [Paenibacillus alvei]
MSSGTIDYNDKTGSRGISGHLIIAFVDSAAGGLMIDLMQAFRGRFPQIQLTLREMTSA